MYFKKACIFAEFPLDPCDDLRGKDEVINGLHRKPDTKYMLFKSGEAMMKTGTLDEPLYGKLDDCDGDVIFLGKKNDVAYFAGNYNSEEPKEGGDFRDMRSIARELSKDGFSPIPSLLARGKMLLDWHNRHQFCANCGAKSDYKKGGYARHCHSCDTEHFPRVDPVVIMTIVHEDRCLLGRSPHFLPGMYSALAGFMEPGETIEEAVRREVMEEVGIRIGKVTYVKSQPWPFPSSLMIGVICEALDDEVTIDPNEIEDAKWFHKSDIAEVLKSGGDDNFKIPEKLAIARHLIEYHLLDAWVDE